MNQESKRTALVGSCHCKGIRYILTLTLPHVHDPSLHTPIYYRCNCTTCHKMGWFHIRPSSPSSDFLLLSPLEIGSQADYTTGDGNLHFLFCKSCGARCMIWAGDGEIVSIDELDELQRDKIVEAGFKGDKVWRPKRGGGHPQLGNYLSVNGHTVDAGQGFDMRLLTESKHVRYCDCFADEADEERPRFTRPQLHGCY